MYNEKNFDSAFTLQFTLNAMREEELPSACIECGACTRLCPQGIEIPEVLKAFANVMTNRH
jgi:predicted aldo/keto reductase-like oxidoreductase